jgi:DNA-binding transcriptional MerR regulator
MTRTTATVAALIGCSPATVKSYLNRYQEPLAAWKAANGRWQYSEEIITRLRQIHRALQQGRTYEEVSQLLANGEINKAVLPTFPVLRTDDIALLVEPLTSAIEELQREQATTKALLEEVAESNRRLVGILAHQVEETAPKPLTAGEQLAANGKARIPIWRLALHRWRVWRAADRGW